MHFIYCYYSKKSSLINLCIKFTKIFLSIITLYISNLYTRFLDRKFPYNFHFLEHHRDSVTPLYSYNRATLDNSGDICSRKSTRGWFIDVCGSRSIRGDHDGTGDINIGSWGMEAGETSSVYPHCVTVFLTLRRLDEGSVALTKI